MAWNTLIFYLLGGLAVLSALGMVVASNPVHSAIFLIFSFFNVAGIFVMLGAEFLAAVQVIVYAGAILVLVLFVLMLVDPEDLPEFHTARPVQRTVGLLLGALLMLELGLAILTRTVVGGFDQELYPGILGFPAIPENVAAVGGNTQAVGNVIFSQYVLAFEVISLVLLVGVVGAIVLALPERLGEQVRQRTGTISLGHPRGTDQDGDLALPSGPRGETPMPAAAPAERTDEPLDATRELILVRDPDRYTTIGRDR
jgi:NADH-quinone oxidoreductase subunit J